MSEKPIRLTEKGHLIMDDMTTPNEPSWYCERTSKNKDKILARQLKTEEKS